MKKTTPPEIADADRALFRDTIPKATTRNHNHKPKHPKPKTPKPKRLAHHEATEQLQIAFSTAHEPALIEGTAILAHNLSALGRKQQRQLRLGDFAYQAILDLHGHTIETAASAVAQFLHHHYQHHNRSCLIIHGKGSQTGKPALKTWINHWLQQAPEVLAYHSAAPKDGGTGALYVLLRKARY